MKSPCVNWAMENRKIDPNQYIDIHLLMLNLHQIAHENHIKLSWCEQGQEGSESAPAGCQNPSPSAPLIERLAKTSEIYYATSNKDITTAL